MFAASLDSTLYFHNNIKDNSILVGPEVLSSGLEQFSTRPNNINLLCRSRSKAQLAVVVFTQRKRNEDILANKEKQINEPKEDQKANILKKFLPLCCTDLSHIQQKTIKIQKQKTKYFMM